MEEDGHIPVTHRLASHLGVDSQQVQVMKASFFADEEDDEAGKFLKIYRFLAHLVFYQTSLCNHDLSVVHSCRPASVSASSASMHSPPSHRIQDRNFIFSMNMHMCPQYMHIKYLVILTYSF